MRGRLEGGTCYVGCLGVYPQVHGRGIGSRLMRELEGRFPRAGRYELFAGHRSEGNLRLYRHLGHGKVREREFSSRVRLVYLEKAGGR